MRRLTYQHIPSVVPIAYEHMRIANEERVHVIRHELIPVRFSHVVMRYRRLLVMIASCNFCRSNQQWGGNYW